MKLARVLLPIKDKESVCIVTNLVRRNCRFSDEVDGDGEGYGSARHVVERDGDFLRAAEITIVAAPVCFPVANAGVAGAISCASSESTLAFAEDAIVAA